MASHDRLRSERIWHLKLVEARGTYLTVFPKNHARTYIIKFGNVKIAVVREAPPRELVLQSNISGRRRQRMRMLCRHEQGIAAQSWHGLSWWV